MLLHFAPAFGFPAPPHGYLAVDIFFCLSGFVLSKSYAARIEQGMSFKEWIAVRLIRLYPLYFLSIILGGLATFIPGMPGNRLDPTGRFVAIVTGILMVPSPTWHVMPELFPLNFVAWSLFVEMLLSVLFFWLSGRPSNALWVSLTAGFIGLILCRIYIGYIGGGFAWRDAPSGLARGLFGFSAGMLIARHRDAPRRWGRRAWVPLIAAAGLMSIDPPHGVAYDLLVIFVAVPGITFFAARIEPRAAGTFRAIGDLSYPIYALHSVAFFALGALGWLKWSASLSGLEPLVTVGLFLAGCWNLDRYYDRPIRKRLSRRLRERVESGAAP